VKEKIVNYNTTHGPCNIIIILLWYCVCYYYYYICVCSPTPVTILCGQPRCHRRLMLETKRLTHWIALRLVGRGGRGGQWQSEDGAAVPIHNIIYNKRRPRWQNIRSDRFMAATSIHTHTTHTHTHV